MKKRQDRDVLLTTNHITFDILKRLTPEEIFYVCAKIADKGLYWHPIFRKWKHINNVRKKMVKKPRKRMHRLHIDFADREKMDDYVNALKKYGFLDEDVPARIMDSIDKSKICEKFILKRAF